MGDNIIVRIERLKNGWEVEYNDPKIQEANRKPKSVWKDPSVGYAFTDIDALLKFLKEQLPVLAPEDEEGEYAQNFKSAVAEDD
jgi:hypothetical protein